MQQEMMGWQWHQLDHMQITCTLSRQITMPAPHHSIFTGRMPMHIHNEKKSDTKYCATLMHTDIAKLRLSYFFLTLKLHILQITTFFAGYCWMLISVTPEPRYPSTLRQSCWTVHVISRNSSVSCPWT